MGIYNPRGKYKCSCGEKFRLKHTLKEHQLKCKSVKKVDVEDKIISALFEYECPEELKGQLKIGDYF